MTLKQIPLDKLGFYWTTIRKKESSDDIMVTCMPFNLDEIEDLTETEKWERLKDLAVEHLRSIKKLPSFAKEQDYRTSSGSSYNSYLTLQEIANGLATIEQTETKKITIFNNAFDEIILPDGYREKIIEVIEQLKEEKKIFEEWGLNEKISKGKGVNLLFSGASGTGKTYCGEIIAKYLGVEAQVISVAQLESKWSGESEKNISSLFKGLLGLNKVLILDEVDSFLTSRSKIDHVYESKLVNQFLIELERHNGICVMTTNRPVHLDKALQRRIDLVLNFPIPDFQARCKIWEYMIPKKMPVKKVNIQELATYEMHGGMIKNCILSIARKASYRKLKEINQDLFIQSILEELKESKNLSKGEDFS